VPLRSLARAYPRQSPLILALLGAALATFLIGIFRPCTAVTKLWVFESEVSVWSSLETLSAEGEWFLFLVILVFTIVFPLVKISSLALLWLRNGMTKERRVAIYRYVGHLGKWSMLDVYIVALFVVYIKSGGVADITIRDGIVVFTASVMLTQFAALWIGRVAERHVEGA
jgi:paraquat-inducible protein A